MSGWITPWRRTDSASPEPASPSKRLRGCFGFAWIASTGTSSSSTAPASRPPDEHFETPAEAAPVSCARQAPSPPSSTRRRRRSGGRRRSPAAHGSAPRRAEPTWHRLPEDERAEVPAHLRLDVRREPRARVDHGEQDAADPEARVEPAADQVDRLHQLAQALQRVVLGLHRHEHAIGRGEPIHGQRPERGRAVEKDEVVVRRAGRERLLEIALAVLALRELDDRPASSGFEGTRSRFAKACAS